EPLLASVVPLGPVGRQVSLGEPQDGGSVFLLESLDVLVVDRFKALPDRLVAGPGWGEQAHHCYSQNPHECSAALFHRSSSSSLAAGCLSFYWPIGRFPLVPPLDGKKIGRASCRE